MVTGHGADAVEASIAARPANLEFVRQEPQLGTGHAVQQAAPRLLDDDSGTTLILNGDVPLIETATARALVAACGGTRLALLTVELADATGYGRIVRGDRRAACAASSSTRTRAQAQRAIREVYTGMMAAPTRGAQSAGSRR